MAQKVRSLELKFFEIHENKNTGEDFPQIIVHSSPCFSCALEKSSGSYPKHIKPLKKTYLLTPKLHLLQPTITHKTNALKKLDPEMATWPLVACIHN